MDLKWASLLGEFKQERSWLVFEGKQVDWQGQPGSAIGNFLCNKLFSGGSIEADVVFEDTDGFSACELVLSYNPATNAFLTAGLGGQGVNYSIRYFLDKWIPINLKGERSNLKNGVQYHVKATLTGSKITLSVDEIDVATAQFPFSIPSSQVGIWCMARKGTIRIGNYRVRTARPKIFMVMEFSSPYNEIYLEVIKRISSEFGIDINTSNETFGPGIILEDIVRQIIESKAVIAEITPANPNVYYEVGYAHAIKKPTILIAEKSTKLPFDVSPFRVLLYENTIAGKSRFEDGLRKHLEAIFTHGTSF